MKKIIISFVSVLLCSTIIAQSSVSTNKILLTKNQKITIVTDLTMDANMGMGLEINSTSTSTNLLTVKDSLPGKYTLGNTLTKMKVNMTMMGQSTSYDSENKEGNSADLEKVFEEKLNKTTDFLVDNSTGKIISVTKPAKEKADTDNSEMTDNLMKMFGDNTDEAIVTGSFEILPVGIKVGDSWSDSSNTKESKTIRTFTLQTIAGNEATIKVDITATAKNKIEVQEMEMEVNTQSKTSGEIITDTSNGIVKKRNTVSDITGTFQMMGQDMPISAKVTTVSVYQ